MKEINELRNKIDSIDDKLVMLFLDRLSLIKEMKELKKNLNLPVTDSKRESDIAIRLSKLSPKYDKEIKLFIESVISISKTTMTD